MATPLCADLDDLADTGVLLQTTAITVFTILSVLVVKSTLQKYQQESARSTVVVVGAGPIGLVSVLAAVQSGRVTRVIIFEERYRKELIRRPQQIAIDAQNRMFLSDLGVDFDNIEGCSENGVFFTKVGVFQEYLLSIIYRLRVEVNLRLHTKFTESHLKEVEKLPGRVILLLCDGSQGQSANLLGISDEFIQHSCRAYGSVASLERPDVTSVPMPETRVHNLTFDLNAYGNDTSLDLFQQGFDFKLYGSTRHRYMALAVPKCESKLVKILKVVLDQRVMRGIYQVCFNKYKSRRENKITDKIAMKYLKFSPRLFEIKLSQRLDNIAYFQDTDMFVTTEGEAASYLNFHTGLDINLSLRALQHLAEFLENATTADTDHRIQRACAAKLGANNLIVRHFVKNGIKDAMFNVTHNNHCAH